MNTKITTTAAAAIIGVLLFAPLAFASEITGNLSSNGILSQSSAGGQDASGTLSGTVVGGTSTTSNGGGGNTGASGGGGRAVLVASTSGSGTQMTISTTSTQNEVSNSGITDTGFPATSFSDSGQSTGTVASDSSTPDPLAITSLGTNPDSQSIPLVAQAGGATSTGLEIGWILLAIIVLGFITYAANRRYSKRTKLQTFGK